MAQPTNSFYGETDARHHTPHVKGMLDDLIEHLRADAEKIEQPKAQAMFETAAEVLLGLKSAFDHYERSAETALTEVGAKM
jgi:hypothetical protein